MSFLGVPSGLSVSRLLSLSSSRARVLHTHRDFFTGPPFLAAVCLLVQRSLHPFAHSPSLASAP